MDPSLSALLPYLTCATRPTAWFADENALAVSFNAGDAGANLTAFSNRYDVDQRLRRLGVRSHFCDFDAAALQRADYTSVVYRISKEKPLAHHLINRAYRCLDAGGRLVLGGEKSEGIKSYTQKAAALFGSPAALRKHGKVYIGEIVKAAGANPDRAAWLDDQHYGDLRPIARLDGHTLYSKPGVFGWNKVDTGSALLIDNLQAALETLPRPPASLLDLGCGYGYLTLASAAIGAGRRVATDNNAAALAAAGHNFRSAGLAVEVTAGDCGDRLTERFDLILCNPPFHQGFTVDGDLTDKFLQAAGRLLNPAGLALFVVNRFVPLPRRAAVFFRRLTPLADNRSFSVFALAQPRT